MIEDALYDEPGFSGDDFANDKGIQRARREIEQYERMINECISSVVSSLKLKKTSRINLKGFVMFKNLKATLPKSYQSNIFSSPLVVSVAKYFTSTSVAKYNSSGVDQYFFGRLKLKDNYPPAYICRETVVEFIRDVVLNEETDFPEHRKFCRQFYVLTNDSHRLKQLLAFKPMDELAFFRDMELEMQDEFLLFRHSRKSVSPEEATKFVELAKVLSRIFG